MKKITALILALILFTGACACAFNGSGYPAWDGVSAPESGFNGVFGGEAISLVFDPDPTYSNVLDDSIMACFFAFDEKEQNYLEMYLLLPEHTAAGDVFSSAQPVDRNSISLYEVSQGGEDLYFAGSLLGTAYPGGTEYEIRIDSVQHGSDSITLQGSMNAKLCRISGSYVTDDFLTLENARFCFSVQLTNGSEPAADPSVQPEESAQPKASLPPFQLPQATPTPAPKFVPATKLPVYTMDPHPAFTLPPDYRVI